MGNIWYVDPTSPTNGSGTSPGDPLNTIAAGYAKLNRTLDQILRVRAGYCYDIVPGVALPGLGVSNVTIEPYGDGEQPIIDGLTWLAPMAGGWTPEGAATGLGAPGYIWSRQLGTASDVKRVFAASTNNGIIISQRVLGEALRRAPNDAASAAPLGITVTTDSLASILATLNQNDPWYGSGTTLGWKLYMWTPSQLQDPSMYYQGLAVVQSGAGTPGIGFGVNIFNTKNLAVNNLTVRGSTSWPFQVAVNDNNTILCEDISFYQCKAIASVNGFKISSSATSTAYAIGVRRVEIRECEADSWTSAKEQEPNSAYDKLSAQNQFSIQGRVSEITVIDSISRNPFHAALSMGAWDSAGAKPIRSGFTRHRGIVSPWATYARSLDVSLCENTCYVESCDFYGFNVVAQLAGAARIESNAWRGMRKWIRKPGDANNTTDGWVTFTGYRGNTRSPNDAQVGADQYFDMRPDGMVFAHNSCDGCYGTPMEFNVYDPGSTGATKPAPSFVNGSLSLWNNLMLDIIPERVGKPFITTNQSGGLTVGVQSAERNAFYVGEGRTPTARWQGTTYTDINAIPGFKNNITSNPMVDADMRPLPGSPLIAAGKYIGTKIDINEKRRALKPTIGAYEVDAPVVRQFR